MNKIKIGIFGISLKSINYGVTALGITQVKILENIRNKLNRNFEYIIFSGENKEYVEILKEQLQIKSDITIKRIINIRAGIKGLKDISQSINECDYIIDLTYGDSFSDIYGLKKMILYSIPKLMAIKKDKKLIIAPQTIGPYKNFISKILAKKILRKATILTVRDDQSLAVAEELSGRDDIVITSDLAMELPYNKKNFDKEKFKVGLNISELLWDNSNEENLKQYGIVIDYKKLVKEIISKFNSNKYELHLVTHVYAKDESKGEYALAQKVHEEFPETILAPKFESPIDAKSYMSGLDLFFGARMHATIGAFSSGVPVIPISYSRKFEGLYGSLGYNYGINLRETTIEEAMKHIEYCLNSYDKLEQDRKKAFEEALNRNKRYHKLLEKIIK